MGFFDNFLKNLGASLATRYGKVSAGKYAGCDIVLGNPPKEKVSTANSFSQIIFLQDKEEIARLSIANDVEQIAYLETIQFPTTGNDGYRCKITFPSGDTCEADLFPSKMWVFYRNASVTMPEETRKFFEDKIGSTTQA